MTCPPPPQGKNTLDVINATLQHLEVFVYHCMDGYSTNDQTHVVCQQDGSLSLTDGPTCLRKSYEPVIFTCMHAYM